jgi:hypothetical protein
MLVALVTITSVAVLAIALFGISNSDSNELAYALHHEGNDTMSMGNDTSMMMNATLIN